jgi:hypothetical protein
MARCLVIIGSLISTGFAVHGEISSTASQGVSKAHLSVEDPRPLAKAIEVLEGRYGWAITYEDPRYVYSSEIKDVTLSVPRHLDKYKPGQAPKFFIPKGGTLTFDYDIRSDTNIPDDRKTVVQELLKAYARSGNAGRFRLESNDRIMHVIPTAIKNSHGQLMPQDSILETRISLTAEQRTGLEKLRSICSAITQATKIQVTVGTVPINLLVHHRDSQGATRQRARDVLVNLLESVNNGTNWSWQLFYDPTPILKGYALNIHQVLKHE